MARSTAVSHAGAVTIEIFHNPKCSTSNAAMTSAADAGVEVREVRYLREPPTEARLREIIAILVDPPTDLIRRDANFAKLGLAESDVGSVDDIVATLVAHPQLLQRPLLVSAEQAIIGRPKDRVPAFLATAAG